MFTSFKIWKIRGKYIKKSNKALIGLFLLISTIVILTGGQVSAYNYVPFVKDYFISANQSPDLYSYQFNVKEFYCNETVENDGDYLWDFGDGTYSSLSNPYHTYAYSGEKLVTATFNIPEGGQDLSKNVYPGY